MDTNKENNNGWDEYRLYVIESIKELKGDLESHRIESVKNIQALGLKMDSMKDGLQSIDEKLSAKIHKSFNEISYLKGKLAVAITIIATGTNFLIDFIKSKW